MKLTKHKLIETLRKKNQGWTTYQARKIAGISIRRVNQVFGTYLKTENMPEIGKMMGARVIASAGSDEKLAIAREKGAEFTINYKHEDVRKKIKEITEGKGANVVYDPVGGDVFRQTFRAMAPEGRMLVIGFASGDIPQVPANHLLVKNIELIGFYWGAYKIFRPEILQDSIQQLFQWYSDGKIKPHISATFPLEKAAEAIRALRNRSSSGKVVVTMD